MLVWLAGSADSGSWTRSHVLAEAFVPGGVAEHEVVRCWPLGLAARCDEQLAQPPFGAAAKIHVPWAERPVLLPGPPQGAQVGKDCGKLGLAEFRQRQEGPPSGQVVVSHESWQLSPNAHTLRMPDAARRRAGHDQAEARNRRRPTGNLAYALPARAPEMPPNYRQQPTIATGCHLRT